MNFLTKTLIITGLCFSLTACNDESSKTKKLFGAEQKEFVKKEFEDYQNQLNKYFSHNKGYFLDFDTKLSVKEYKAGDQSSHAITTLELVLKPKKWIEDIGGNTQNKSFDEMGFVVDFENSIDHSDELNNEDKLAVIKTRPVIRSAYFKAGDKIDSAPSEALFFINNLLQGYTRSSMTIFADGHKESSFKVNKFYQNYPGAEATINFEGITGLSKFTDVSDAFFAFDTNYKIGKLESSDVDHRFSLEEIDIKANRDKNGDLIVNISPILINILDRYEETTKIEIGPEKLSYKNNRLSKYTNLYDFIIEIDYVKLFLGDSSDESLSIDKISFADSLDKKDGVFSEKINLNIERPHISYKDVRKTFDRVQLSLEVAGLTEENIDRIIEFINNKQKIEELNDKDAKEFVIKVISALIQNKAKLKGSFTIYDQKFGVNAEFNIAIKDSATPLTQAEIEILDKFDESNPEALKILNRTLDIDVKLNLSEELVKELDINVDDYKLEDGYYNYYFLLDQDGFKANGKLID